MEWISVKDELPKEDGDYLVATRILGQLNPSYIEVAWYDRTSKVKWSYFDPDYGDIDMSDVVTHWMPLPLLPGKE